MTARITLTFDNGPHEAVTPAVLDVLARHDVRSTFFVLGKYLEQPKSREMLDRVAAQGHWIGNHTYSHTVPLGLSEDPRAPELEIGRTQTLIAPWVHPDRLFRPFGGGGRLGPHLLSEAAREYLMAERYTCVLWNAIPRDWADPEGWVDTALELCRSQAWSLMVLHDYDTGAMRHLDRFIMQLRREGFEFRQDFPPDCVPLRAGQAQPGLEACVSRANGSSGSRSITA